jgi:hypothetical protein
VGLPAKAAARQGRAFFAAPVPALAGFLWALRLNHITTADGLHDLMPAVRPKVVVPPKTKSVAEVETAARHQTAGGADGAGIISRCSRDRRRRLGGGLRGNDGLGANAVRP